MIKDLFYSVKKGIFEIYREASHGNSVDFDGFLDVVRKYSNNQVGDADIEAAFRYVANGRETVTYETFEKHFKWELPGGAQWETVAIRMLREYMFKNSLNSETMFELLCKRSNKMLEKRLTRVEFHKAMNTFNIGYSAPQLDSIFTLLD